MKADKRLAEIQERIKVIPGRETLLHGGAIAEDMQYLLDHIAELEKLLKKCKRLAYQYRRGGLQPLLVEIDDVLKGKEGK